MEKVIVAFESEKNCTRIKEILESSNTALCTVCRTAAEVRRAVGKQRVAAVVCGYKFSDGSAEGLFDDLPISCAMLLVAVQNILDLVGSEDIFKLPAPVSRGDLVMCVRMLLQVSRRLERYAGSGRSGEDQALIEQAKAALMEREAMTEEQAHRFLQKKSMDSGVKIAHTAREILAAL